MKKLGRVLLRRAISWILSIPLLLTSCAKSNSNLIFKKVPEDIIAHQLVQLSDDLKPFNISVERADSINESFFWESPFVPTYQPECPYDGQKTWPDNCPRGGILSLHPAIEVLSAFRMEFPLLHKGHSSFYLSIHPYHIKGLLMLSSDSDRPKPLIIFRGGIGSKADSFRTERHLILSIAFHLGYHILFVGSSFNDDTLSSAKLEKSGPFVDRELNLFLGHVFSSSKLKKHFESIYLIGLSMSGAGALLTADAPNSPFSSILLMCPFLNYPELPEQQEANPLDSNFLRQMWVKYRFPKTISKLNISSPPLFHLFQEMYSRQIQFINQQNLSLDQTGNTYTKSFPKILRLRIENLQFKTNTRALLTVSDGLVNPKENEEILSGLGVPIKWLQSGYHCALHKSYPSATIAQIIALLLDSPMR